jgi:rhodanese-related sulfurtransferase
LGHAGRGEVNIGPAGEAVFEIPSGFAVANENKLVHGVGSQRKEKSNQPLILECVLLTFSDWIQTVTFILDNWMLLAIALSSGFFLLLPVLQGAAGAGISPTEAVQLMNREKAVVVDVCSGDEYAAGHVGGARHVPLGELQTRLGEVVKNKSTPIILVCASGMRSKGAQAIARKLGYEQVHSLQGGLKAWKEANLPVEKS